jgi:hypothetical protein
MRRSFTVNSERTCQQMVDMVRETFQQSRYATFQWETGVEATQEQKALFHIWLRRWVGHALHKPDKDVTLREVNKMKEQVKEKYYQETGAAFMIEQEADHHAPNKKKAKYTSMSTWSQGEAFQVMEWMQARAADSGLILESTGEHQKLKERRNS